MKHPPAAAADVFGDRLPAAVRYAAHLATSGVERGLIGPRETDRLWDRHLLNCAVVAEVVPAGARLVDVGSGAGLPGIPLALARPDLHVVLIEPLARRVDWLDEIIADLDLPVQVVRGRAEEKAVRRQWEGADVVTARAVAPMARLAGWALPLLRAGGILAAIKGTSVADEVARDVAGVRKSGGGEPRIVQCGVGLIEPPTTVVLVERLAGRHGVPRARTSRRKERRS
ncbi:16S rRNA (guanine(527)-N(7))-methyltransferase RsmG [Pseudonocardia asaccharolytica]|uniref:16S rRNA (guanine(527)-N(7))-methyltransferase RsmG n=1 Tax=Pseudonocardia asaccharolytica TaxID=54010 RepID=UPI00041384D9|nr:16S rRNA (guanine(527)-N(7))-methyltransferase RsmG [Pseudonocardia asaccharolytica]